MSQAFTRMVCFPGDSSFKGNITVPALKLFFSASKKSLRILASEELSLRMDVISCPTAFPVTLMPKSSSSFTSKIGFSFVIPPETKLSSFKYTSTLGGRSSVIPFVEDPPILIAVSYTHLHYKLTFIN